jgi:hypothetical protein
VQELQEFQDAHLLEEVAAEPTEALAPVEMAEVAAAALVPLGQQLHLPELQTPAAAVVARVSVELATGHLKVGMVVLVLLLFVMQTRLQSHYQLQQFPQQLVQL